MDLVIMNFRPAFCPGCGKVLNVNRDDWECGASQQCKCGIMFQNTSQGAILEAAAKHPHGDLNQYV